MICCFQTTLARLFHPLTVSIKGTTMSYPRAETLPSKCVKTCQILGKQPETAQVLLQTPWHLQKT